MAQKFITYAIEDFATTTLLTQLYAKFYVA